MDKQNSASSNLDLLRATAVLCVFATHLVLTLLPVAFLMQNVWAARILYSLGNAGVLMFFVHTSLVLLRSLERSQQPSLFLDFYIRRIFRIYPLSIACIAIVLLLKIPYAPKAAFVERGWYAIVSNLLLIQNLTNTQNVITPFWSLPPEVQMYAMLPLIFVVLRRFGSAPLVLVMWWTAAFAAPHASLLQYVPCFMGGVLAYQMCREKTLRLPAFVWPMSVAALGLFYLWFRQRITDEARVDYVFCMLLGGFIPQFGDLVQPWLTRASYALARYSYGIYLFHSPVIWFACVKLGAFPAWVQWASLCVLMCVIPWAAYTWLEAPLIEAGRRAASRLAAAKTARPAILVSPPVPGK